MRFRFAILCIFTVVSACKKQSSALSTESNDQDYDMETELQSISLQGEAGNLLSISWNVPVFDGAGKGNSNLGKKDKLLLFNGFKTTPHPVEQGIDILKADPRLVNVITSEYAGLLSVNMFGEVCEHLPCRPDPNGGRIAAGDSMMRRFYGYCLNDKVYALQAFKVGPSAGQDAELHFEESTDRMELRLFGTLPPSYRPDISGCKARFQELVKVKLANGLQAINQSSQVETINFIFSFLPGYSGTENYVNGNKVLGIAEITADIATLGLAAKFKAGWKCLGLTEDMIKNGLATATVVANTVRLGSVIQQMQTRGAQISDVPTLVLLVTETGFAIAKIKINFGKRLATAANVLQDIGAPLQQSLEKLGRKLIQVEPGSIRNLFKGKFAGMITPDELSRIRQAAAQGGDLSIDDLHKLISNTSVKTPETMINVTADQTLLQILDSKGTYWGYVGFPGLPKGVYATPKPISWSALDLMTTQGSSVERNVMLVFVGDATKEFKKVKSGFFGQSVAFSKTVFKPSNPEFATVKTGDVRFTDFKVYNDGAQSVVVVKKLEIIDELHGTKFNSPEYAKLTRIQVVPFCTVLLSDTLIAGDIIGAGAVAAGASVATFQWLFSRE